MLDVRRLRVFRHVAREGSFLGAAHQLHFSQSAVSQQIAALEREAGTQLVERHPRGVNLTPAGKVLLRHANTIVARLDDAQAELGQLAEGVGGRLRLATFQTGGAVLMPSAIAAFRRRFPGVELTLTELEPDPSLMALRAGDVDLALIFDFRFEDDPPSRFDGIERIPLLLDKMSVVLPREHRAAAGGVISVSDLGDERWVEGSAGFCHRLLARAGVAHPTFGFMSDDYTLIQGLASADVAISFFPGLAMAALRRDVAVRALSDGPVRHIEIALRDDEHPPVVYGMIEILAGVVKTYAEPGGSGLTTPR